MPVPRRLGTATSPRQPAPGTGVTVPWPPEAQLGPEGRERAEPLCLKSRIRQGAHLHYGKERRRGLVQDPLRRAAEVLPRLRFLIAVFPCPRATKSPGDGDGDGARFPWPGLRPFPRALAYLRGSGRRHPRLYLQCPFIFRPGGHAGRLQPPYGHAAPLGGGCSVATAHPWENRARMRPSRSRKQRARRRPCKK